METDGRIRSKDIETGGVNSRIINNLRSENFNGSKTSPELDPGTAGWQILKSGFAVFNEVLVRGTISAARIVSAIIESGTLTVVDGGAIQVENPAGDVIVTLDSNGLEVDGTSIAPPPIGAVLPFVGSAAPTGYLLCQGQAVSRTTYSGLFAVAGTAYGSGDGSTTFNVPNLQQRFPLGKATSGTGSTLGGTGGSIDHVHTQGNTGSGSGHDHTFSDSFVTGTESGGTQDVATGAFFAADNAHTHSGSVSGTTSAESTHNHTNPATAAANPPFQVVNFIVKH